MGEGRRWLWVGIALAILIHLPGLTAGPVADDPLRYAEVANNLSTALEWFYRPFPHTQGPLPADFSPKLYRPVWHLSYWLDGQLFSGGFGGAAPLLGPRLVSLGLHILLVLGVASLARRWDPTAAPVAAALVAVHPLMVAPVAWVSARGGLLAAVCLLGAAHAAERRRWMLFGAAVLMALGSKETALVAPALLFVWTRDRRVLLGGGALTVGVLLIRWRVLGTPLGGFSDLPALGSPVWWAQLPGHLKLWLCGVPGGTLVWLGGIVMGALAIRGLRDKATLFGAWLLLTLLPHHRLFADPTTGLNARFLADAAVPLCVAVAMGLATLPARVRTLGTGLLLLTLTGASVDRVLAWRAGAARVEASRNDGTLHTLPAAIDGVPVRANLLPALEQPPWTR